MSMIRYVYHSSTKLTTTQQNDNIFYDNIDSYSEVNSLIHKWDAYTQRLNYDAQKRHERYIRDRDAGKTGYLGGRRVNTGLKYRTSTSVPSGRKRTEISRPQQEQPQVDQQSSKGSGSSGGSGRSGGSGGSGRSQADQEEMARIKQDIAAIREASAEAKAKLREDAKEAIEQLRDEIKEKSEEVKSIIESYKENGALEREEAKSKSDTDIENLKDETEANIQKESEALKKELDSETDPIRKKIAELRGRLDSISDPTEIARLKKEIARHNEDINGKNEKYTESLFNMKTEHTSEMRSTIADIRKHLQEFLTSSKENQQSNIAKQRSDLKELREKNNAEIKKIREQLKSDIASETENAKQAIANVKSGDKNAIYNYTPTERKRKQTNSSNGSSTSGQIKSSKGYSSTIGSFNNDSILKKKKK